MTLTSRLLKAVQALGPILGPHGKASKYANKISKNRDDLADPARFELATSAFRGQRLLRPVAIRLHEAPDGTARNAEIEPPSQGEPKHSQQSCELK